jgi:outer membrane protein insertion porin family/translocation and assembly module TamA
VTFKPGVVFYPTRVTDIVAPTKLLPEERLRLELRQPGLIEARTNGFIRPELNIFPVLLTTTYDPEAPVIGYGEFKGTTGLDRTYWKLFANLNYNFQAEQPFVYAGTLDPALALLILSYPELLLYFDFRNDRVKPHKGAYIGNSLQFAGGPFGGHARDLKVQPEARVYVPVTKRVTWATRTTVGFLFPFNYGNDYQTALDASTTDADRKAIVHDLQIIYFRGFFSGGPSSNRGYPLRAISPAGVVPFLSPDLAAAQIRNLCDPNNPDYDVARCAVPLGGFTLWEASTELRIPITGPFSMATFCDASDVSAKRANIRLTHPHLSCGLGLRYDTPVGPIRLDIGYRIPGLQVPPDTDPHEETDPGDFFGIPLALAFGIGEAF